MHRSRSFRTLAATMLAAFAWAGTAAAQPITPEEVTDGWIALFDGESLYGWDRIGDSEWRVENGIIVCDSGAGGLLATSTRFTNAQVIVELELKAESSASVILRGSLEGHPSENGSAPFTFDAPKDGGDRVVTLSFTVQGNSVAASEFVDGDWKELDTITSATMNERGRIAIAHHGVGSVQVRHAKLKPLGLEPIFNGTDLSGWNNPFPDRASIFSVVDGALNIKDGNGQIETDATWRDFLLQMQVYSNGEHLNSGVFFRGPVGVFWRGYESQLRNQWIGDDRTKPVDYGTGGIYGRQAARKVVSSDHEWFHKTIVSDGHQFAVWVNGIQVSNLLDTRPPVDNGDGKQGFVPEAGTIHLQGHDPATDLSFKGIYIQSYDK